MEMSTVMKTFHGNLNAPKSPTMKDREASFSSYLRPDKPILTSQHHHAIESGRCRALDDSTSELSIFDAHKYFNEVTNNDTLKVTISSNSKVSPLINNMDIKAEAGRYSSASSSVDVYANIRNYRARSFHAATPTASSEASWNSQAGLLSHPPGAIPVSMRNPSNPNDVNRKIRASLSKPIWLLRRKCPCTGKKSVEVKEKTPEPKIQMPPTPKPQPSQNQIAKDSLNIKRQDLGSNPKMPIDKFTMNKETEAKKTETPKIHITPNNWVDQTPPDKATFAPKSQRLQPEENQLPAILQSQRIIAPVRRPFTEGFTFPVLNPNAAKPPLKLQVLNRVDEDPPRDSLEVFRPPDIEPTSNSSKTLDRNHHQNFPFPPSPNSRIIDEDAGSDASSDLFEIESFSTTQTTSTYPMIYHRRNSRDSFDEERSSNITTTTNSFLFNRRSSIDESMAPTITECYEPSEASIEWSVTTAEGYNDRASVTNFSADDSISTIHGHGGGGDHAPEKCNRRGLPGNGLLSSCRCEKAVSIGPQPVKCVMAEGQQRVGSTSSTSTKHANVISRVGNVNKPPLAKSHTARMFLAFAT